MNTGLFAIGLIVLLLGVLASSYTITTNNTYLFGAANEQSAKQPYKDYSVPFVILGIVLMVVGAAVPSVTTTTKESETVVPEKRTKTVTVRED